MKKIRYVFMILVVAVAINGYAQVKNKDEMIKKVFTILKNKDEDAFVKLFPDAATMKAFVSKIGGQDSSDAEFFKDMTDSKLQKQFRGEFARIIKKGELKGVNWSAAEFVSYISDSAILDEETMKVTALTGTMYFNSANKEYFLRFEEMIWFPGQGWYGVEIRRIDEKSKEGSNEIEDMTAEDDRTLVAYDSAVAPIKKPVQKPKQPVKKTPVKVKTTTPARKPE